MTRVPDPRAEKIKARKEAKAGLRKAIREDGIAAAATLFLETKHEQATAIDEDCPDCRHRQGQLTARFLGYDPTTNRAFAQIIR